MIFSLGIVSEVGERECLQSDMLKRLSNLETNFPSVIVIVRLNLSRITSIPST